MTQREIISAALRKLAIIASGETPSSDELNDGLAQAQALVLEHPNLSGCRWRDVYASSDETITACDGQRIDLGSWSPAVTLPTSQSWLGLNRRAMPELSRVQIVGGPQAGLWLFSEGLWRQADALTLESENPFGPSTNDGVAAQLAIRLAGDYGKDPTSMVVGTAARSEKTIRGRLYRAERCRSQDDYQFPQYPFDPFLT